MSYSLFRPGPPFCTELHDAAFATGLRHVIDEFAAVAIPPLSVA
ncbi:hypothetical protein [Streptomyces sp. WMMB 322]